MATETVRAHVVLPRDLIESIDALAGDRSRSEFVEEALREKLARERMGNALAEAIGSLNPADYPEWSTPEKISRWVHDLRRKEDTWRSTATD